MPHLTYSESDVGSTLHQRNAKTTYTGPWKLFLFTTTNCLFMYNPSSILHPKEKADWLHQWIWIQVCWMVGRQGLLIPLMGWEQRVHFLFILFFVLFCWLVLFFFFSLINIEFLMDRQALGQKDVFTIQTSIHRKLLSLVCSEGSSLWRLSTAWQTIWMNASQCGRLGSRIGTGLEAGVYLPALLKGGGLEDINPGLSLSQLPWMESGFVKMLVGKAAVSQWKKQQLHPFFCQLLHTCLVMTAAPPQTSCYASLKSPAQRRGAVAGDEANRCTGQDPHPTSSMGHSFFGIVWILLIVWNFFCWGPKSVLITVQESNSKIWILVSAKSWVLPWWENRKRLRS